VNSPREILSANNQHSTTLDEYFLTPAERLAEKQRTEEEKVLAVLKLYGGEVRISREDPNPDSRAIFGLDWIAVRDAVSRLAKRRAAKQRSSNNYRRIWVPGVEVARATPEIAV